MGSAIPACPPPPCDLLVSLSGMAPDAGLICCILLCSSSGSDNCTCLFDVTPRYSDRGREEVLPSVVVFGDCGINWCHLHHSGGVRAVYNWSQAGSEIQRWVLSGQLLMNWNYGKDCRILSFAVSQLDCWHILMKKLIVSNASCNAGDWADSYPQQLKETLLLFELWECNVVSLQCWVWIWTPLLEASAWHNHCVKKKENAWNLDIQKVHNSCLAENTIPRTTVQPSMNGGATIIEDGGFSTFELRRSQRGPSQRRASYRNSLPAAAAAKWVGMQSVGFVITDKMQDFWTFWGLGGVAEHFEWEWKNNRGNCQWG